MTLIVQSFSAHLSNCKSKGYSRACWRALCAQTKFFNESTPQRRTYASEATVATSESATATTRDHSAWLLSRWQRATGCHALGAGGNLLQPQRRRQPQQPPRRLWVVLFFVPVLVPVAPVLGPWIRAGAARPEERVLATASSALALKQAHTFMGAAGSMGSI